MQISDLKVGTTFEMDGSIYTVLEIEFKQQPRLAAVIRGKIKNLETGQVMEKRFGAGDKIGPAYLDKKDMQYLYSDDNLYYFMDVETYDQIPLNKEQVEDIMKYVKEGSVVSVHSAIGRVVAVEPPIFVNLKVTYTEPAIAGDTAKSALKAAELETGFVIRVPLFVNNGDVIKVDTRTGEYVERV